MILYKLLQLKINERVMFEMCPLVHNLLCNSLDNWHLAYCDPTRSKDHKTVDCECLFIQQ